MDTAIDTYRISKGEKFQKNYLYDNIAVAGATTRFGGICRLNRPLCQIPEHGIHTIASCTSRAPNCDLLYYTERNGI